MSAVLEIPAPLTDDEDARLAALARYDVLDTPREPAFDRIANLIRLIFGVEISVVSLIDAHRQWYKAVEGLPFSQVPLSESFCRYTIAANAPVIVPDLREDARFRDSPFVTGADGVRFYASVPLTTSDGLSIGTICAVDSQPRQFSEKDVLILREFAEVAINELELRRLATSDGLTGISTRRAFREDAQKFVALARRHRSQLSVIAFDIDHFKAVNDTYGHAAGDSVLKAVTQAVGGLLRQSDLFGRLGGEEFAVLLPDADHVSAMAVAEKLRHALLNLRFPGSKPPMTVSASFGVATLDPGQDDIDRLLVKADEALYEAKRGGRNLCVAWRGSTAATTKQVERRRVLKAGRLVFNERQSVISCTVRALWDTGAEATVSNSADIPDTVTLEIPSSDAKWSGTVTVRRPQSIEIAFD